MDQEMRATNVRASSPGLLAWLPSPTVLGLATVGIVIVFRAMAGGLDPDAWWHLATGRYIAAHGLPVTDPFSFTWAGQPWTPPEWGAELLINGLVAWGGTALAALAFGLAAALALVLNSVALRRSGAGTGATVLAGFLGGWVLLSFVTIRPQVLSWAFLAGLVLVLIRLDAQHPRRVLVLVPLFAVWANVQGLWVVGLGVVGLYVLFTLLGRTAMRGASSWAVGGLLGATLAVMATPAGPGNLLYPLVFVKPGAWGLVNILEWQSPDFHAPENWAFLALVLATVLIGLRGAPGWLAATGLVGIGLGLASARSEPVAVVLVSVPLGLGLDRHLQGFSARWPPDPATAMARRLMETATVVIVIVVAGLALLPASPLHARLQPLAPASSTFPAGAVDRLVAVEPAARVLAYYDWGGYVIERMYAGGGRVFIDSRADMYSDRILNDYLAIQHADTGWPSLVAGYGVQALLFRPSDPISAAARTAGWCEAYRDADSVLLLPSCPGAASG